MDDFWMIEQIDKDGCWEQEPDTFDDKAAAMAEFKRVSEECPDLSFNLVRCEVVKKSRE